MPIVRKWSGFRRGARGVVPAFVAALASFAPPAAHADAIPNPVAVFNGLDKITGRIVAFEVGINETVQFGSLQLTPRICNTRPPTEAPNTNAFLEVDEVGAGGKVERLFTGWVFASSPGLHGIEHPVYDIWLTDCRGGTNGNGTAAGAPEATPPEADGAGIDPNAPPPPPPRRLLGGDADALVDAPPPPEEEAPPGEEMIPADPLFAPIRQ
ncbi:hypothetical protein FHS82_000474 [Pseudochelatococcus lubricantis]|uniref:DUF2155 domain-containing protein n=1 Tax=Pseudochelatococcus lubricantis TaxID=1538102 RepID=A0ABX0V0N1_9HYPH|nr:DUF2155 domain-containing protein [Pseudochelatococcus lubricantis]NIJ56661.1 hypothetical protein [Pseudochelatococcus lubricantis]